MSDISEHSSESQGFMKSRFLGVTEKLWTSEETVCSFAIRRK